MVVLAFHDIPLMVTISSLFAKLSSIHFRIVPLAGLTSSAVGGEKSFYQWTKNGQNVQNHPIFATELDSISMEDGLGDVILH